jgi:hypothetical protein
LKDANYTRSNVISKLKHFEEDMGLKVIIENFLKHYQIDLYELYGRNRIAPSAKVWLKRILEEILFLIMRSISRSGYLRCLQ